MAETIGSKRRRAGRRGIIGATALFLISGAALAQTAPEGFSIGIGAIGGTSIYVDEGTTAAALPILRYQTEAFSVGLPDGLRFRLIGTQSLRVNAVVTPRFPSFDGSTAIDRDLTLDAGLAARYRVSQRTSLAFRAVAEVTDEHGGYQLNASVQQAFPTSFAPILLGAGLIFQDDNLASYLYGVESGEATSRFAAYSPGDVVIPFVSVGTSFPLSERVSVIGDLRANFMPDNVVDSPIVEDDLSIRGFIGISYRY